MDLGGKNPVPFPSGSLNVEGGPAVSTAFLLEAVCSEVGVMDPGDEMEVRAWLPSQARTGIPKNQRP